MGPRHCKGSVYELSLGHSLSKTANHSLSVMHTGLVEDPNQMYTGDRDAKINRIRPKTGAMKWNHSGGKF